MVRTRTVVSASFVLGLLVAIGCGSGSDDSAFGDGTGGDGTSSGGMGGDGFGPGSSGTPGGPGGTGPCVGLQCKQVACAGGATTSLSGKVYDPSGTVPLYNAVVFVPNADLDAFAPGVTCDKCGTTPSGKPVTTTLTDATGSFTLKNVPVGVDVPLVVQIGRWRRRVTIPAANVAQCKDSPVAAANTRLPRNKSEGSIPKIAITTGGADSLECFLRKMGLDAAEFTNPTGTGSVHLYQGLQKDKGGTDGSKIDGSTPAATELWEGPDASKLKKYDITILSCEGSENNTTKSVQARTNLREYLDAGGRVFASHFHYTWFKNGSMPLPQTATWTGAKTTGNSNVSVDTSFAKGQAFSEWLDTVSATTAPKSSTVAMTALRADVTTVPGAGAGPETSRRWLYTKAGSEESKFYSFNAPIGNAPEQQCGRGVFTDIHVSSGDTPGGTFPTNCTTTGYTPQEKALLFLLMDLASCIQDDSKPPTAPPTGPTVK